ncbi:MAG: hypothetical protein WAU81_06365 [Candidatus Aminicenantales bacterium]
MATLPSRCSLVLIILIALPAVSPAQLVLGQYEDEAPLRSWNTFGLSVASSLGRGETQLALAEDCSAALGNPALLPALPKFSVCLNGSYSYSSFFRYSIVNTGVLVTEKNPAIGLFSLDFAGISYSFKGWAVALTAALTESYDRPDVSAQSSFAGRPYYAISFDQSGYLRNFNLAAARKIGRNIQVGVGFNFVRGELSREVIDQDFEADITISHSLAQRFSGFYLNAGLLARISERLDLGFVFRTSCDKKADSRSLLRYRAPRGGTDILIEAASDDIYRQPWAAGVGVRYVISAKFRVLGDLIYFPWSKYRAEFFGESERRDFRDTLKAGGGGEYSLAVRLFGYDAAIPLRLGISYDRQPMRNPVSAYTNFSFGAGVRWRMVVFDIGGLVGRESGSGHSLKVFRIASSLGIRL